MTWLASISTSDINLYDEEAYAGDSILPFLGFCLFVASIIIIFLAVVNIVSIKRDFKIFYDASELAKKPDMDEKKRRVRKHTMVLIAGIILMIVSRMLTYYG